MSERTWLYLYENKAARELYVGIGARMDRVWQQHNDDAERLRQDPSTLILQTTEAFSTERDAKLAESIAIHVAMLAGIQVTHVDPDLEFKEDRVLVTNRAETEQSSLLGPAVFRREGSIRFDDLRNTSIVTITADQIDERPSPYGGHSGATFSERACKFWGVDEEKRPHIRRLIAILKGAHNLILGDWDVDPLGDWRPRLDVDYGTTRVVFPLVDPASDDVRGVKGMILEGFRGMPGPVHSSDVNGIKSPSRSGASVDGSETREPTDTPPADGHHRPILIEPRSMVCPNCQTTRDTIHVSPDPDDPDREIRQCEACDAKFAVDAWFECKPSDNERPDL
ncbi:MULTISPECIES: hypothetical protein [unclassified Luteococcus]|uniref:hypothetical protein n=1 Tax=unclassified Luteococcus TaxID=2639923 RepID=UPI00313D0DD1